MLALPFVELVHCEWHQCGPPDRPSHHQLFELRQTHRANDGPTQRVAAATPFVDRAHRVVPPVIHSARGWEATIHMRSRRCGNPASAALKTSHLELNPCAARSSPENDSESSRSEEWTVFHDTYRMRTTSSRPRSREAGSYALLPPSRSRIAQKPTFQMALINSNKAICSDVGAGSRASMKAATPEEP